MQPSGLRLEVIVAALTSIAVAGCHARRIPAAPVVPPVVTQTGPGGGWPPQTVGVTNLQTIPALETPGSLTEAFELQIRRAAEADTRVRALLGERFAYLAAHEVEPPKGSRRPLGENLRTVVVFYNHSNNMLVEARMRGATVDSASARPATPAPPAGQDEMTLAIRLARADANVARQTADLRADAIEIEPARGQPGAGHRVLYVTFSREEAGAALYFATVDLSDQRVLNSGAEARR